MPDRAHDPVWLLNYLAEDERQALAMSPRCEHCAHLQILHCPNTEEFCQVPGCRCSGFVQERCDA